MSVPQISMLGGLEVRGPEPVALTFRTRKTTAMFAYLALRAGQRHGRDFLCELFWPDSDAAAARLSLRVALSSLRKTLADAGEFDGLLRVEGVSVWIDEACAVDAAEFERLFQLARAEADPEERLAAVDAALATYSGPLVPNCDEALLVAERARLSEMAARLWRQRGQILYRQRRFDDALAAAEASLALEPDAEAAYRIAIRCDLATGRPDAAARKYRQLESRLLIEGRAPEPKTLRLGQELVASPAAPTSEASEPKPLPQDELPQPLTSFFGRGAEIDRLAAMLVEAEPSVRLITLLGLGGSGKTRLAVELARRVEAIAGVQVAWLALAGRRSVAEVRSAVASAFEVDTAERTLGPELSRRIGDDTVVLVLDNLEHLLAQEAMALRQLTVELLESTPRLRILGASRLPLEVPGEMRYVVPMLPMPEPNSTAAAAKEVPAVQLFIDRARRRRADFELDETNVADVAEIVTRLDGMPLALELAAIWVTALSPAALVQRLSDRFDLLASGEADVDARHKRLESVIEASVDRLPEECLELYLNLCVLPDAATLEVAQAVGGLKSPLQTAAQMTVLVERALARRERRPTYDGDQFFIPECLREYGAARLGEDRRQAAMQRAIDFVMSVVKEADRTGHSDILRASRAMRPIMPILEGVLAWCEEMGWVDVGLRIATAWPALWSTANRQLVGREFLARFLNAGTTDPTLRYAASTLAAELSIEAGEIEAAEPFVKSLFDDWDELPFVAQRTAIDLKCHLLGFAVEFAKMADFAAQLEAMLPEAPTPFDRVQIMATLCNIRSNCGDHVAAAELGEELIDRARQHLDRYRLGGLLAGYAFNLDIIRSLSRAEAAILEAIDIARESNHIIGLAHRLWIYGGVIVHRDRVKAREVWNESLAYHRETNNRQGLIWVLGNLAAMDLEDQQFVRAEPLLRERLKLARALNDHGAIHQTYGFLARLMIATRNWDGLHVLASERHHYGVQPALASFELGWIAEQRGLHDEAQRLYREALAGAVEEPDLALLARVCLNEPVSDEVALREAFDRLEHMPDRAIVPRGSEILDQAIRTMRLRRTLTTL